ncbi:MAG: hypothetical protein K2X29_03610 [Candidatus Obscuribacterales bacterium]|nr:hypothetical protein [Candidatus Obscuribacterales bacterium]
MDIKSQVIILTFSSVLVGLLLKSNPRAVKTTGLIASGLSFGALLTITPCQSGQIATFMPLLIAAASFLCILSQQLVRHAERPIIIILAVCGFSYAYLNPLLPEPIPTTSLGCLLGTLALLSLSYRRDNSVTGGAAVAFGVALLCLVLSFFVQGPLSVIFRLVTAATLLPLFPLHAAFVGSLSSFAGTCPAFLAVVLPCLGLYTIIARISMIPAPLAEVVIALAITGAVLTTTRASVQIHLGRTFAAIGTILLSLAWLTLGTSDKASPEIAWYVMSVTVVTSGLLLCSHQLESRYGTQLRENLRGLAHPMPKLSLVLGVLIMAAAGFPPFAIFSMFMAMVLSANQSYLLLLAPAILLVCSLLLVSVMKQLLFGARRSDFIYEDLGACDLMALLLITALVAAGGFFPYLAMPDHAETAHSEQKRVPKMVTTASLRDAPRTGSGTSTSLSDALSEVAE